MMSGTSGDVKEFLVANFKKLKGEKSGKEWRKLLKSFNPWHLTDEAGNIWRNAGRGLAGNEGLRQLVADMKAIVASEQEHKGVERMTAAQIQQGRQSSIQSSALNLRRRKRGIEVAAK